MKRVLLVQPSLQPPGGGNGVAAWILQALVQQYAVTVLSLRPVEVEPINRFFGTTLRAGEFHRMVVPRTWSFALDHLPVPAALLRASLLMRYTRRVGDAFDVIVGAHNEADYGRTGVQYIHYPSYLRPRPTIDYRWYHRSPALLNAYYGLADRIAGFSLERMKSNVTLANSHWTAALIHRALGIGAQVIYPPATDPGEEPPWSERRTAFVAIGRISPEKEYERAMRILARVRQHVPDVTLTIIGTWDPAARRYLQQLRRLAASLGPWIDFRFDVSRDEVRAAITTHRYGIHAMREEHFGMTPAEMVRGGAIVWVPRGGGQVEIVGAEPALWYESEEEAADKILRVLGSIAEQTRLREHLRTRGAMFGVTRFVADIHRVVGAFTG